MSRKKSNRKPRISNKTLTAVVCVLAAVSLLAGGIYIDTFHGSGVFKSMLSEKEPETEDNPETKGMEGSMEIDISSKAAMAVFGEEFMLCTKDGVKYYAAMGDQLWSDTFNMSSPAVVQEGDYLAVGDLGGKAVRVYNREGMLYDLQAEGTPVQFALNEKGYLSLITRNDGGYRVRIYNAKGTLLKERVEENSGVYPLSSDISDDNRTFAVSYLDTTDIDPIGRVVMFYIDAEESEEHTDSMYAGLEKEDEIIPVISYRAEGILAVISDSNVYGVDGNGEEKWSYPLENTIDQVALDHKEYIVLAMGDGLADKEGREKGLVCWLDSSGKEKASFETGDTVTYLRSAEKGVVIGNDHTYVGVNNSGSEGWRYTATADMDDLIVMDKLNHVMLVSKESVSIYDMSKANGSKVTEEDQEETAEKEDEEEFSEDENAETVKENTEDASKEEKQTEDEDALSEE